MENKILRLFLVALLMAFQAPLVIGQGNAPGRVMGEVFMNRSTDLGTGQVFFVHNSGSNEPGQGGADFPFASLDYAIGRCGTAPAAASTGCTIFLMEGHAETLIAADAVDVDVAGIKAIGLGTGNLRPTFTMATAAAAEINVDAANFYLANIIIVDNIACTACVELTANADGFHANNILIREGSQQPAIMIDMTGQADDVLIENSVFLVPTADTGATGIDLSALTPARFTFRNNVVRGDFNVAALFGSGALTDAAIHDNVFNNLLTGQFAVEFTAASLGYFRDNLLSTDLIATALDPGSLATDRNMWTDAVGTDGRSQPIPEYSDYVEGFGYRVIKTGNDLSVDEDPLFTVTGMVLITLMVGEVTTGLSAATDVILETDGNIALTVSSQLDGDADGVLYIITGDPGAFINGIDNAGTVDHAGIASILADTVSSHVPMVVGEISGTVTLQLDTDTDTGIITWILFYIPISPGATVIAAA